MERHADALGGSGRQACRWAIEHYVAPEQALIVGELGSNEI
jgi:hypothetical protein